MKVINLVGVLNVDGNTRSTALVSKVRGRGAGVLPVLSWQCTTCHTHTQWCWPSQGLLNGDATSVEVDLQAAPGVTETPDGIIINAAIAAVPPSMPWVAQFGEVRQTTAS